MKVTTKPLFKKSLKKILIYIGTDSKYRAKKFNKALFIGINSLDNFPYKFRKSIHFNDEKIRDYIFMGYTIPYLIDSENDIIIVLDIFKWTDK
jgi:plasmid stabilization system protein ParE